MSHIVTRGKQQQLAATRWLGTRSNIVFLGYFALRGLIWPELVATDPKVTDNVYL